MFHEIGLKLRCFHHCAGQGMRVGKIRIVLLKYGGNMVAKVLIWLEQLLVVDLVHLLGQIGLAAFGNDNFLQRPFVNSGRIRPARQPAGEYFNDFFDLDGRVIQVMQGYRTLVFYIIPVPGKKIQEQPVLVFEIPIYAGLRAVDGFCQFFKGKLLITELAHQYDAFPNDFSTQRTSLRIAKGQFQTRLNADLKVHIKRCIKFDTKIKQVCQVLVYYFIAILSLLEVALSKPTKFPMKHWTFSGLLLLFAGAIFPTGKISGQGTLNDPLDSPQTLEWVIQQANRVDNDLANAMRSSESIEVLIKLADCYILFDAVAIAGVYCTNVRAAAEAGRRQCDVINYRLEKDLNTKLKRAVEARRAALLMREAANICLQTAKQDQSRTLDSFAPVELIWHDAQMVQLDLADGLASKDLHILAQKTEHAIRLLHDIAHLASSLTTCETPAELSEKAILQCEAALSAPNWTEVHQHIHTALEMTEQIRRYKDCK